MKYAIKLTPITVAFLNDLHPDNKKFIKASLKNLSLTPYSGKELQEELAGFLSYRIKRFRIIYKVDDTEKTVFIYLIGHRKDVYELFHDLLKTK